MLTVLIWIAVLLPVLYFFARRTVLGAIEYRRYFSQTGVFEGEDVVLFEEISNHSFLPLVMVDVEAYLSGELQLPSYTGGQGMQEFISRFFLPPFTQVKRSIRINCARRGYYTLDSVIIQGRSRDAKAEIYVYPRALAYEDENPMATAMQNTALSERRLFQDPFSFSGVRDYRYGDSFRSINYKATAKTGAVKVNERDFFSGRNIMLYIDFNMPLVPLPTPVYHALMEQALSHSADLVEKAVRLGYNVGFAANCRTLRANHVRFAMRRGHEHFLEILREMALIRMAGGCSFPWLAGKDFDSVWNTDIYIMTTNPTPEMDDVADIFRSQSNHVTMLMLA